MSLYLAVAARTFSMSAATSCAVAAVGTAKVATAIAATTAPIASTKFECIIFSFARKSRFIYPADFA
jgi:hypothetical protein